MTFYVDNEANERANKISEGIEMISASIDSIAGIETSTDIDAQNISYLKNRIADEPTVLAKQLMEISKKSLNKIKSLIGKTDKVYNQLSERTAICIIGILDFPINQALHSWRKHDSQYTNKIIELRTWINESTQILEDLKNDFYLSTNTKERLNRSLNQIKY